MDDQTVSALHLIELNNDQKRKKSKFWGSFNVTATLFLRSNFTVKHFIECLLCNKGILESITSVHIVILLLANTQGNSITSNVFLISSPPKYLIPCFPFY